MPQRVRFVPLLSVIALLAACGPATTTGPSPSLATQDVTVLLGFRPDVQFAPFYVAQQEGYFADAGLDVTIEHRSGGDLIRLVADGQADLGVADATDVMISRTAGIPIRYVSTLYARFPVVLIGAAGTVPSDPADLAGMRIGTPGRFGSSWHALLALLDAGGLGPDDVEIREYPAFNQVEGLLNGDVDLITGFRVNEPLQLASQGMEVATLAVDEVAPLPGPGIIAGDALLADDPELVARFSEAIVRAQEAIAADVDLGLEAAITEVPAIGEDRETARAVLEASVDAWRGDAQDQTGEIATEVWAEGYAIMQRLGLIDGSVAVDEMYAADVMTP